MKKKDEKTIASLQNYLDNTDWYITRKQETGKEIPEEILTARREAGPLSSYVPAAPIIDAYRDEIRELHVLLTVRSSTLQPGEGRWEDFLPEEAYEDCIEL